MNRTIKFRVWDKENQMMYNPMSRLMLCWDKETGTDLINELIGTDGNYSCTDNEGKAVIMQFTGLKDKNGKEIYEGDIVNQEKWVSVGEYAPSIGVVKYKGVGFTCECVGDWAGSNADLNGNASVIGNIYSNPDLLQ